MSNKQKGQFGFWELLFLCVFLLLISISVSYYVKADLVETLENRIVDIENEKRMVEWEKEQIIMREVRGVGEWE